MWNLKDIILNLGKKGKKMENKRKIIDTVDNEGKPLKIAIVRPGHKLMQDAKMAYNLKCSELIRKAVDGGQRLLLRSEVEDYLIKTKIWTNDDVLKIEKYGLRIRAIELVLQRGGIKISDARKLALEMSSLRAKILELYNKKQQLDSATVEAVAENDKFSFLMTKCVVSIEDGKPLFVNEDDYLERGNEIAVVEAAKCLAGIIYGLKEEASMSFYENQWLKDHNFIDKMGRLVNKDGAFVDQEGKKVNEAGQFIDTEGSLIDNNGIKVDKDGNFIVSNPEPFLDDDNKPIVETKTKTRKTNKNKKKK